MGLKEPVSSAQTESLFGCVRARKRWGKEVCIDTVAVHITL